MFGLEVTNNYDDILFSDTSYVLEYAGKASWQQRYNYDGNSRYWYYPGYNTVYSHPRYIINRFLVDIPIDDLLCFSNVPWPSFTAITYTNQISAGTTEILVIAQENETPTVYCFRKIQPKFGGYGIALRDASGNLTFTSNSQILIPRGGSVIDVPYTSQGRQRLNGSTSFSMAVNGPDQNSTYTNLSSLIRPVGSISKPALAYYAASTAVVYGNTSSDFYYNFVESGVRYNAGAAAMEHQFGFAAFTNINSRSAEFRTPAHTAFCMMIDGAQYD